MWSAVRFDAAPAQPLRNPGEKVRRWSGLCGTSRVMFPRTLPRPARHESAHSVVLGYLSRRACATMGLLRTEGRYHSTFGGRAAPFYARAGGHRPYSHSSLTGWCHTERADRAVPFSAMCSLFRLRFTLSLLARKGGAFYDGERKRGIFFTFSARWAAPTSSQI